MKSPVIISLLRWCLPWLVATAALAQNSTQVRVTTDNQSRSLTIYHRPPGPPAPDFDQNGLPDEWEEQHFGHTGVDPDGDLDHDGLSNRREVQFGSDPNMADSDHDGVSDGQEVADATDPNNATSGRYAQVTWQSNYTVTGHDPVVTIPGPGVPSFTYAPANDNGHRYRKITVTRVVTGDPYDNNGTFVITAVYQPNSGMWQIDGNPTGDFTRDELESMYFYPPRTAQFFRDYHPEVPITETSISWQIQETVDYYGANNYGPPVGTVLNTMHERYEITGADEPETTGGGSSTSSYASNDLPQASRNGSNATSVRYRLEVPPTMTGTLRWLEIFTPSGNSNAREFTAHSWMIDGSTSPEFELSAPADGSATLQFFSAELAVDANRDGQIKFASEDSSDATTANSPYLFWLNTDNDQTVDASEPLLYTEIEQDDKPVLNDTEQNWRSDVVSCERDLEDFSRLWINTIGLSAALKTGDIKMGLCWNSVNEYSGIKLFRAAESDGGQRYLFDPSVAAVQAKWLNTTDRFGLAVSVTSVADGSATTFFGANRPFFLPDMVVSALTESHSTIHLLFEGCTPGTGTLRLQLYDRNNRPLGDLAELAIGLSNPSEFIERWSCGDTALEEVQPVVHQTSKSASFPPPSTDDEKDYVLYVHGFNMQEFEKQKWIETTFKRLFWLGYKGRTGGFTWPCAQSFPPYDQSEERAWQSAEQLRSLLKALKTAGYRVHVLGHSQGNVVVGEALRQWKETGNQDALARTYIASQAAIQADLYDPEAPLIPNFAGSSSDDHTPNVYANYPPTGTSYLSPAAMSGAASRFANFQNPRDYALTGNSLDPANFHPGWQINQRIKPHSSFGYSSVLGFYENSVIGLKLLSLTTERFRIFCYAAEGRSLALGSTPTGGVFSDGNLDLSSAPLSFGEEHRFHSGQFRSSMAERYAYWQRLMRAVDLTPNGT